MTTNGGFIIDIFELGIVRSREGRVKYCMILSVFIRCSQFLETHYEIMSLDGLAMFNEESVFEKVRHYIAHKSDLSNRRFAHDSAPQLRHLMCSNSV